MALAENRLAFEIFEGEFFTAVDRYPLAFGFVQCNPDNIGDDVVVGLMAGSVRRSCSAC
jgi:hypothetical protein